MATGIFTCFYGASCRDPLLLHSLLRQHRKLEDPRSVEEYHSRGHSHFIYQYLSLLMVSTSRWLRSTGTSIPAPVAHDLPTGDMRYLGLHRGAVGHGSRWSLLPFELKIGPVLRLSDWNRSIVRSRNFCVWRRENVGLTSN